MFANAATMSGGPGGPVVFEVGRGPLGVTAPVSVNVTVGCVTWPMYCSAPLVRP